jgi:glucose/arabinose dehydrogenase
MKRIHPAVWALIVVALLFLGTQLTPVIKNKKTEPPPTQAYAERQYDWKTEVIANNLEIPWDLAQLPDGSLLVTERTGKLKLWQAGVVSTVAELPSVQVSESGLTGITLHPAFETNRWLYLYYTYRDTGVLKNKVGRYRYENGTLIEDKVILSDLAGGQVHNGGRLRFGPDGKLYVLTGDAARPSFGQDSDRLEGKILRLNDDGSVPADNPQPGSLIYSSGHRNPQGLSWHPLTEELLVSEHGESAYDEINKIEPGKNYGWATARRGELDHDGFTAPLLSSGTDTWAPSGLDFIGISSWDLRDTFIFAGLRSMKLQKYQLVNGRIVDQEILIDGQYGRLRAVLAKGDGSFYVTTSNRDGRVDPGADDDRILLLTPVVKQ